jgi:hypothetical protein
MAKFQIDDHGVEDERLEFPINNWLRVDTMFSQVLLATPSQVNQIKRTAFSA